jgi:hypothetical protein
VLALSEAVFFSISTDLCLQLLLDRLLRRTGRALHITHHLLQRLLRRPAVAAVIDKDSRYLHRSHDEEAEVNGGQTAVIGLANKSQVWYQSRRTSEEGRSTYNIFAGRITKHHLVQILPVAINARFCVNDNFSAGLRKSLAPANTTPHFITGALDHLVSSFLHSCSYRYQPTRNAQS